MIQSMPAATTTLNLLSLAKQYQRSFAIYGATIQNPHYHCGCMLYIPVLTGWRCLCCWPPFYLSPDHQKMVEQYRDTLREDWHQSPEILDRLQPGDNAVYYKADGQWLWKTWDGNEWVNQRLVPNGFPTRTHHALFDHGDTAFWRPRKSEVDA